MLTRLMARAAAGLAAALFVGALAFATLDALFPPDLARAGALSRMVVDRDGRVLRVFLTPEGAIRLPVAVADVAPRYLDLLLAFEDRRFRRHPGVDALALARAAWQALRHGRVVSGASTITMQTARLLEPRPRTLGAKLTEMFRALQLERRYTKDEILGLYLTLAPYGGRLEGIRAASLVYFGKEPAHLTAAEAALLVALPQAPSRLRPDRAPDRAQAARDKVIARAEAAGIVSPGNAARMRAEGLTATLRPLPMLAPHLARALAAADPAAPTHATWIDATLQASLEALAARAAAALDARASVAILVVENEGRRVRAYVGSADFFSTAREGQVDMAAALRSPGSTLKPLIYGLAFDFGLAHPETLVRDAPRRFGDYRPVNFGARYMGEVSLGDALRFSLNVPAVALLDALGPVPVAAALARSGVHLAFGPRGGRPGLAMALGGVGVTLVDLVRLYAALADDGRARPLAFGPGDDAAADPGQAPLMRAAARWYVGRILLGAPRPRDMVSGDTPGRAESVAFKTGTSYGYRDAWAIGYDAAFTVGVWVGRADGTPSPGRYGLGAAAPLLFQVFDRLPAAPPAAPPRPPAGALVAANAALPPGLRRLAGIPSGAAASAPEPAPDIIFPPNGAEIALADLMGPLPLAAEGGRRPLRWLVNGQPLGDPRRDRRAQWLPDGPGFAEFTVIDALGRGAHASVYLVATPQD